MEFINPQILLWLLAGGALLGLSFAWASRRRRQVYKVLSGHSDDLHTTASAAKRRLRKALFIAAIALVMFSVLRPFAGKEQIIRPVVSRNIIVALDLSKSMNVKDAGEMSRLDYAKWWAREFVNQNPDDRIGLLSFGGATFLECPMTRDRSILLHKLNAITTDYMPVGGTDLELALKEAKIAGSKRKEPFSVIMLTDGDEVFGNVEVALKELRKKRDPGSCRRYRRSSQSRTGSR